MKTVNQHAWWFVLPVLLLVAFNALVPLMTVVNYSVQETFGNNVFFWSGLRWFGWEPAELGFWASFIQSVGTLCFNVSTFANGDSPRTLCSSAPASDRQCPALASAPAAKGPSADLVAIVAREYKTWRLADDEFHWEPLPGSWGVHPASEARTATPFVVRIRV